MWRAWALVLYLSFEHRCGPILYFGAGLACADERAICSRAAFVIGPYCTRLAPDVG